MFCEEDDNRQDNLLKKNLDKKRTSSSRMWNGFNEIELLLIVVGLLTIKTDYILSFGQSCTLTILISIALMWERERDISTVHCLHFSMVLWKARSVFIFYQNPDKHASDSCNVSNGSIPNFLKGFECCYVNTQIESVFKMNLQGNNYCGEFAVHITSLQMEFS